MNKINSKKIHLIVWLFVLSLVFIMFKYLTSLSSNVNSNDRFDNRIYNFAGILPAIKDKNNTVWVYFAVEYQINNPKLALLAGKKEAGDLDFKQVAIRELNEESLDVFSQYINYEKISSNNKLQLNYNIYPLLSVRVYMVPIDYTLDDTVCDKFITEYNQRRYKKPDHYKQLNLAQRESYELRKVRLKDLIKFINNPYKYQNKISSYGGKACLPNQPVPMRWSSRIILQQQDKLNDLEKSI